MVVGEGRDKLDFAGHTLNVSETGLALIVPVMEIDEFHQMGEKAALRIELHLPDVAVEIHAKLVPYERTLEESTVSEGCVIGAEITWVSDPVRYKEFLQTLNQ